MAETGMADVRLNRFLAEAGVCSRRDADDLIFSGKVTVNGHVAGSPAMRLDPENDAVKVDGKRVQPQAPVYVLLHKPDGVVSTVDDPERRTTVVDLLKGVRARVFPVGRLDFHTSGLLLMTNDGDLALRLTHPRYGFSKTYRAQVEGVPSSGLLRKLAAGVFIPAWGGRYEKTMPARVRLLEHYRKGAVLELTLREGRQHQVRKMCAAIGHPVKSLVRTKFGFLTLAGLAPGRWRYLTAEEISRLRRPSETAQPHEKAEAPAPHRVRRNRGLRRNSA